MCIFLSARTTTTPRHDGTNDCVHYDSTSDGLLVMLNGTSPLHLHHTPLDAAVADVAEVLGVLLHALCHWVRGGGSEASLALLEVLMVSHLEGYHSSYMYGPLKTYFHASELLLGNLGLISTVSGIFLSVKNIIQ